MAKIVIPIAMMFVMFPLACEQTQPSTATDNFNTGEIDTATDSTQIDSSVATETETNSGSDAGIDTASDATEDTETDLDLDTATYGSSCTVQADCVIPTPFCINQRCYACSSADRYRCNPVGECSNLLTDADHCGECDNACADPTPACTFGECKSLTELKGGVTVTLPAGTYTIHTSGLESSSGSLTIESTESNNITLIVGVDSTSKTGYWVQLTGVGNDIIATLTLQIEATVTFGS